MRTFLLGNGVTWVAALLATGCVLGLRGEPAAPPDRPAPRKETVAPKPANCAADCRYLPGYWHWDGGGYVWIPGRWERDRQPVANSPG